MGELQGAPVAVAILGLARHRCRCEDHILIDGIDELDRDRLALLPDIHDGIDDTVERMELPTKSRIPPSDRRRREEHLELQLQRLADAVVRDGKTILNRILRDLRTEIRRA